MVAFVNFVKKQIYQLNYQEFASVEFDIYT